MEFVKKPLFKIIRFLREVRIEMKRVNWLGRKEVINYTILVLAVSIVTGVFLGGLDVLFQRILTYVI
ncbi:MAG: preprotein translocase subunit SecE [Candidatus Spechtbacterales bacterium]|nr:preprotein translocase subunit SecE [Candidatus Spechtbacterales bacterium]